MNSNDSNIGDDTKDFNETKHSNIDNPSHVNFAGSLENETHDLMNSNEIDTLNDTRDDIDSNKLIDLNKSKYIGFGSNSELCMYNFKFIVTII